MRASSAPWLLVLLLLPGFTVSQDASGEISPALGPAAGDDEVFENLDDLITPVEAPTEEEAVEPPVEEFLEPDVEQPSESPDDASDAPEVGEPSDAPSEELPIQDDFLTDPGTGVEALGDEPQEGLEETSPTAGPSEESDLSPAAGAGDDESRGLAPDDETLVDDEFDNDIENSSSHPAKPALLSILALISLTLLMV